MKTVPCVGCGKPIIFLKTKKGAFCPINAETVREGDFIFDALKGHISHFATCADAGKFRKPKTKKKINREPSRSEEIP